MIGDRKHVTKNNDAESIRGKTIVVALVMVIQGCAGLTVVRRHLYLHFSNPQGL